MVLDPMIPEIDGLAVIRAARERGDVPILILSARGAVGDRTSACPRAPTTICPSRSPRPSWSCGCGRSCAGRSAGRRVPPGTMLVLGDLEVDPAATASRRRRGDRLSALELRLLGALLDADGRVLTRDQLLDAIHGEGEGDVIDRAIDQYVKRLREKLGDDPAEPRYVATVRGPATARRGRSSDGERPVSAASANPDAASDERRPSGDRIGRGSSPRPCSSRRSRWWSSRSACSRSGRPRSRR